MYDYDDYDDLLDDYEMRNARRGRHRRHGDNRGSGLIRRPGGWGFGRPVDDDRAVTRPRPRPVPVPVPVAVERGGLLGNLDRGELIEIAGMLLGALMPLPAAPAPTENAITNQTNQVLYQQALAAHAKLDERIRTLGSIVGKLID
jgi:hypothetical protein